MKSPAFQFYADDFYAGTAEMLSEEVGVYILLLCAQWTRGGLPDDPVKLERLARGKVSEEVLKKFPLGADGARRNAKLETIRLKQEEFRKERSEAGKKGSAMRWGNSPANGSTIPHPDGSAIAQPLTEPKPLSPSPTPTPTRTLTRTRSPSPASVSAVAPPTVGAEDRWPDDPPEQTFSTTGAAPAPSVQSSGGAAAKPARDRDPLFDALVEVCFGNVCTVPKSAGGRVAKALAEIKAVKPDLTPEDLRRAGDVYRKKWPKVDLTPTALSSNWPSLRGNGSKKDLFSMTPEELNNHVP